jgi:hypothetical protein
MSFTVTHDGGRGCALGLSHEGGCQTVVPARPECGMVRSDGKDCEKPAGHEGYCRPWIGRDDETELDAADREAHQDEKRYGAWPS